MYFAGSSFCKDGQEDYSVKWRLVNIREVFRNFKIILFLNEGIPIISDPNFKSGILCVLFPPGTWWEFHDDVEENEVGEDEKKKMWRP